MRVIFGRFERAACVAGWAFNSGGASFLKLATGYFNDAQTGSTRQKRASFNSASLGLN